MPQAPSIRKILCSLVNCHSRAICYSAQKCKQLLMDNCSGQEHEVNLLVKAIEREIPSEMIRLGKIMPEEYLLPKFTRWLCHEEDIVLEEAEWSVNSWAMALGLIAFTEKRLTPTECS
jgi:hypothetical protein